MIFSDYQHSGTPQIIQQIDSQLKLQVQGVEKAVTEIKRQIDYIKKDIRDTSESTIKTQRDQYVAFQGQLKNVEALVKTELAKAQLKLKEDMAKAMTQMPMSQSPPVQGTAASQARGGQSSQVDESEIKKLINLNVSRMQQYMQSQVDSMKLEMDKGIGELTQILPKVMNYDKELRLVQASVR